MNKQPSLLCFMDSEENKLDCLSLASIFSTYYNHITCKLILYSLMLGQTKQGLAGVNSLPYFVSSIIKVSQTVGPFKVQITTMLPIKRVMQCSLMLGQAKKLGRVKQSSLFCFLDNEENKLDCSSLVNIFSAG